MMGKEKMDFRNPAMLCTLFRIASAPVTCLFLFTGILPTLTFTLKVAESVSDFLDGFLAKNFGYATNWGRTLDPPADKMSNLGSMAFILCATFGWLPHLHLEIPAINSDYLRFLIGAEFILLALGCSAKLSGYPIQPNLAGKAKMVCECLFINIWLLFALRPWGFTPPKNWATYPDKLLELSMYLALGSILWHALEWCLEAEETDEEIIQRKSVSPHQRPAKWVIALGAFLQGFFEKTLGSIVSNPSSAMTISRWPLERRRLKPPTKISGCKRIKQFTQKYPH